MVLVTKLAQVEPTSRRVYAPAIEAADAGLAGEDVREVGGRIGVRPSAEALPKTRPQVRGNRLRRQSQDLRQRSGGRGRRCKLQARQLIPASRARQILLAMS